VRSAETVMHKAVRVATSVPAKSCEVARMQLINLQFIVRGRALLGLCCWLLAALALAACQPGQKRYKVVDEPTAPTPDAGATSHSRLYSDGPRQTTFRALRITSDGGYIAVGQSANWPVFHGTELNDDSNGRDTHIVVVKTNADGTIAWQERLSPAAGVSRPDDGFTIARGEDVQLTPDGGYIVAGRIYNHPLVVKLHGDGSVQWQWTWSSESAGLQFASATRISVKSDSSGYLVIGDMGDSAAERTAIRGRGRHHRDNRIRSAGLPSWYAELSLQGELRRCEDARRAPQLPVREIAPCAFVDLGDVEFGADVLTSNDVRGKPGAHIAAIAAVPGGFIAGGGAYLFRLNSDFPNVTSLDWESYSEGATPFATEVDGRIDPGSTLSADETSIVDGVEITDIRTIPNSADFTVLANHYFPDYSDTLDADPDPLCTPQRIFELDEYILDEGASCRLRHNAVVGRTAISGASGLGRRFDWMFEYQGRGPIKYLTDWFSQSPQMIVPTRDGGSVVVGSHTSADFPIGFVDDFGAEDSRDIWVMKLSAAGDIEWQNRFQGPYPNLENYRTSLLGRQLPSQGFAIAQTDDGSFRVAGEIRIPTWLQDPECSSELDYQRWETDNDGIENDRSAAPSCTGRRESMNHRLTGALLSVSSSGSMATNPLSDMSVIPTFATKQAVSGPQLTSFVLRSTSGGTSLGSLTRIILVNLHDARPGFSVSSGTGAVVEAIAISMAIEPLSGPSGANVLPAPSMLTIASTDPSQPNGISPQWTASPGASGFIIFQSVDGGVTFNRAERTPVFDEPFPYTRSDGRNSFSMIGDNRRLRVVAYNANGYSEPSAVFPAATSAQPTGESRLTVRMRDYGDASVRSTPGGIDCPANRDPATTDGALCMRDFPRGVDVILTAEDGMTRRFLSWGTGVDCVAIVGRQCTVRMDGLRNVEAIFAPN
jgi:hypothetical protein